MKLHHHKLLKLILANREASLEDLSKAIDVKHNDYKDYFPLACLVVSGYISCDLRNSSGKPYDEKLLASIFYSKVSGEEQVNNYHNSSGRKGYGSKLFTMTAKTQLYFDELRAKRVERMFTALISITVGVSSALITLAIKSNI